MNLSPAYIAAVLAALPADALAQCNPEKELNRCERALFVAATEIDSKRQQTEIQLSACREKLNSRTSTVIRRVILPCPAVSSVDVVDQLLPTAITGAIALALGLVMGVLVAK